MEEEAADGNAAFFAAGEVVDGLGAFGEAEGVHGPFDLAVEFP